MTFLSGLGETAPRAAIAPPSRFAGVAAALVATLIVTAIGLSGSTAAGIPNSDDLLRMVEVRDLLGGQSWFDLAQYRLGLDGGTPMHWSRLVDAPIAAIVMAATALTGEAASGEAAARLLWPALTLFVAMLALMRGCLRTGHAACRMPVAIIGAIALWTTGAFAPGALDHHNIQIALALWLMVLLLPGDRPVAAHGWAGFVAVAMLAIGMEVLPYVALAGLVVALRFATDAAAPAAARAFGLAVAGTAGAIFAATVAPGNWSDSACDAYSAFHLVVASAGGLGLAGATLARSPAARWIAIGALGAGVVALVALAFPHCLANPLAGLDPRLKTFWLEGVVETRSFADLWASDRFALIGLFAMPACAFAVAVATALRAPERRGEAVVFAAFLAMGLAVTAWQQRGFTFATAFAVLPLGFLVGRLRAAMPERPGAARILGLAAAWAISINLLWWMAGATAAGLFTAAPTVQQQIAAASPRDYCYTADLYAPLAAEPAGVVLGATDIGASVLLHTQHRAVAGPYHRNTAGNLLLIDAMLAPPAEARAMLAANGVTLIADCLKGADGFDFIAAAPNGLQAALRGPSLPTWLEPVVATVGEPLVLYRVLP
ncbi:GtrA family protein [Oricola sp.]|uniref:GtrA family protein n=1 Tax=Oricola sp. TaxID=1979950 RepID=UPI0025F8DE12|nr:GtrA family protein [Oricola sp.]MCI5077597.1 GtrA family protein [Oricola sp.]